MRMKCAKQILWIHLNIMYTINETKPFKKAIKQLKKSGQWKKIEPAYNMIINRIKEVGKAKFDDPELNKRYKDHDISGGNEKGTRDVHVRPDLILIYINRGNNNIDLLNISNHASSRISSSVSAINTKLKNFSIHSRFRLQAAAKLRS